METPNLTLPHPPLSNPQNPQNLPFSQQVQQQAIPPKIKPLFPKTVKWKCIEQSPITKYQYKGLSSIKLFCDDSYENNPESLIRLHKFLKQTKRLLSLTVLNPGAEAEDKALNLEQLPYFLNATSRLRKLCVSFDHLTDGEDITMKKNFEKILIRFRKFRDLSSLDITLNTPNEIANPIQIRLFKQLKGLTKLRNLSLDISGCDDREPLEEDFEPEFFEREFEPEFYQRDYEPEYFEGDSEPEYFEGDFEDESLERDSEPESLKEDAEPEFYQGDSEPEPESFEEDSEPESLEEDAEPEYLEEDSEPNALIFTSKYPRSLRSLFINFRRSSLPHIEMLPIFASNLSRCHSLEFLGLDCDRLSPNSNFLAPVFQMTKSLKALRVSRDFSVEADIHESQNFAISLECLKHLTGLELRISMDFIEVSSKEFVKSLFIHLSSLTNLESLKLELNIKKFPSDDDPDFQETLLNLKSLSCLQTLDLSLPGHSNFTMNYLQSLLQAFQSLSYLRNFRLNLPLVRDFDVEIPAFKQKISHQNIITLSLMLKNLNRLKTLSLTFNDTEVGSDSLEILFSSIAHFQLSSLLLDVRQKGPDSLKQSEITFGEDAKATNLLFSTLPNFATLSSLELNLSNLDFKKRDLKELSLSLEKLKQLTHLSLKLGPQEPRVLLPSLKEMPKLDSLHLICSGELSDDTIGLLALSLMDCRRNLKSLSLQFRLSETSKDTALEAIGKGLETLISLKNLTIKLKRRDGVFTERRVLQSLEVLSFPKKLESVVIDIPFQRKPRDCDVLRQKIRGHLNLEVFKVNSENLI